MNTYEITRNQLLNELNNLSIDIDIFSSSLLSFIQDGNELCHDVKLNQVSNEKIKLAFTQWENKLIAFLQTSFKPNSIHYIEAYKQTNHYGVNAHTNIDMINVWETKLLLLHSFYDKAQVLILHNELKACQNHLEETQRIAKIGTYSVDIASGNWTASKALEEIMGIDEHYPKTYEGGQNLLHPTWRQKMHDYFLNEVVLKKGRFDIIYQVIRPNTQEVRWVHGIGDLKLNEQQEPVKLVAVVQDITEQVQAQETLNISTKRYRDVLNNIDAGVVIHSSDTSILECNPKALSLLGLTQDQVYGKLAIDPEWKFINEHNQPLSLKHYPVNLIKSTKAPLRNLIVGVNRPLTNDVVWALVNGFPVIDDEGNILEIVISFIDMTEHRKLEIDIHERMLFEDELKASKEKAEESEKLKTAFLQNMSHEIRTPLNAISGFIQMLDNPNLSAEKRKSFSSIIKNSSNQLLSIVGDILTISSLETKQEKIAINPVNINSILIELLAIFKQQAADQNIMLYVKQNLSDHFAEIYTDRVKLTQILSNLVSNALKFTSQGTIEFGYQLKKDVLEFFVIDSGIGIPQEQHQKIFERFQQANIGINQQYGGTGLGLAISKGFVELLGGEIWLKSEVNKGAAFFFTIPYQAVHAQEVDTNLSINQKKKSTVLIAEDVEINFLLLEEIFNELGCTTIHAKNGQEAVDICLHDLSIDVVFMDIKMPILNGYEAAKLIKQAKPQLPIIAQTGYAYDDEKEKYAEVFNAYITKPFDLDDLITLFKKFIRLD